MIPDARKLYEVCEQTWPPARSWQHKGWTLRDGQGGGKRVSAATQALPGSHIDDAEAAMQEMGQAPLFMLREGEEALDAELAAAGYAIVDPVYIYACELALLTDQPVPPVTAFTIWEPLALMEEIWALGGIGPARLAVMARAGVKTGVLGRWRDKPAGVAFAAVHDRICMVHAVEILPHQRRQGMGKWLMRKAAFWAADQGATHMSVLCTIANDGANALYASLGMRRVGQYHYRQKTGD